MNEQRKAITREQLYHRLWTVPISRLTVELGYSYVELVKICTELNIPRPTGGYWYRLQHGGASEQVPLPSIPDGANADIPFGPRLSAQLQPDPSTGGGEPEDTGAAESTSEGNSQQSAAQPIEATSRAQAATATSTGKSKQDSANSPATTRVAPKFPDVVEMTREELYQQVWTTPIHLLAEALGLSDVGLAKTCVQLEVRKPGRGYWARLDAGESVEKIQLPPPSAEAVRKWTFKVAANRQRRADWVAANLSAPIKGRSLLSVALPSEGEPLHEIAERHRVALEKAKSDENGFVHLDSQTLFHCDISAALVPKLVRAIHALVAQLENHRCRLVRGDKQIAHLSVAQGDDRLSTALVCLQDRLPSAAIRRVQPLQLQEQEPSMYCSVWYSMFGLESEAKLQTRVICLVMIY